jgi:hypothetical protein
MDDALSDGIFMAALMSRWWGVSALSGVCDVFLLLICPLVDYASCASCESMMWYIPQWCVLWMMFSTKFVIAQLCRILEMGRGPLLAPCL